MFTEFKFSTLQISDAAVAAAKALSASQPGADPAKFAAHVVAQRLRSRPERFLEYGPYWWAVKAALRALGEEFGPADDAVVRAEYGGDLPPYSGIVAGEQFREHYLATYLVGTSQFWLDSQAEESYVLFDPDMEIRRLGGAKPLLVSAELQSEFSDAGADAPVLDSAGDGATPRPFAVKFEHEAQLWTANVYAVDADQASSKVRGLEKSGRLMRAIEFSKTVGDAALDSADTRLPLYVDRTARKVCEMAPTGELAASHAA